MEGNALRLSCTPGSEAQVRAFVERVRGEDAEDFRGYGAIASIEVQGSSVLLGLHGYEEPLLKEVRPGHTVACHLF